MMRNVGCWAGVWLLAATMIVAAEPVYRWKREVQIPKIQETSLIAVPVDSHFYGDTRDGWPDVTVRNDKGEGVGFVIVTHSTSKKASVLKTWEGEKSGVKLDEKSGLQVELTLKDSDPQPEAVVIQTPLRDFEHQVKVETSKDGKLWEPAGASSLIFDYSRYVDARNDRVALPKGDYRRVRITIGDVTAEQESQLLEMKKQFADGKETKRTEETAILRRPFRIDRIQFAATAEVATGTPQVELATIPVSPRTGIRDAQVGVINKDVGRISYADVGLQREPVTGIQVVTGDENFSRSATVRKDRIGKGELGPVVGQGVLTRLSVGSIRRDEMSLNISEIRSDQLLVEIDNKDSTPVAIKGVVVTGPQYYVEFLAVPGGKYFLEYGSEDAEPRRYDTAALTAARGTNLARVAGVLEVVKDTGAPPMAKSAKPVEFWNDPTVLVSVIIVFTVLLGFGLFRAAKRIDVPVASAGVEGPKSDSEGG